MLFCVDCKKKLCLKCVSQHSGHTISDFEDVCKTLIVPQINVKKEDVRIKLNCIDAEMKFIGDKTSELEKNGSLLVLKLKDQIETLINEIDKFGKVQINEILAIISDMKQNVASSQ